MCVCTITAQQLELDLAHTLKTTSVGTQPNDLFVPTREDFNAAVEMALRDGGWLWEQAQEQIEQHISDGLEQCVEEDVRHYFNRNFNVADHIDIDEAIERVLDNYDFDSPIESHVDNWLCNNLDVDDAVNDAVNSYFDDNVDVDEVAKQNITEILKDMDFIEALAIEIVRQQNHKEAQPFIEALAAEMLRQQQQQAMLAQIQGEANESL